MLLVMILLGTISKENKMAKKQNNKVAKYDEIFAEEAKKYIKKEKISLGQTISLRGGVMSIGDKPIPGNSIVCVILESAFVNTLYEGDFNPDELAPPVCYAVAIEEDDLAPPAAIKDKVNDTCQGCVNNEWGSAARGRGKACRNGRRLAIIPAGEIDKKSKQVSIYDTVDEFSDTDIVHLGLSPTNIKAYSKYVHEIFDVVQRPPFGVITKISVEPNAGTVFRVVFEYLEPINDSDILDVVYKRHLAASDGILFGFDMSGTTKKKSTSKEAAGKKPTKKKY